MINVEVPVAHCLISNTTITIATVMTMGSPTCYRVVLSYVARGYLRRPTLFSELTIEYQSDVCFLVSRHPPSACIVTREDVG